jgi:hypothetical protein
MSLLNQLGKAWGTLGETSLQRFEEALEVFQKPIWESESESESVFIYVWTSKNVETTLGHDWRQGKRTNQIKSK